MQLTGAYSRLLDWLGLQSLSFDPLEDASSAEGRAIVRASHLPGRDTTGTRPGHRGACSWVAMQLTGTYSRLLDWLGLQNAWFSQGCRR